MDQGIKDETERKLWALEAKIQSLEMAQAFQARDGAKDLGHLQKIVDSLSKSHEALEGRINAALYGFAASAVLLLANLVISLVKGGKVM